MFNFLAEPEKNAKTSETMIHYPFIKNNKTDTKEENDSILLTIGFSITILVVIFGPFYYGYSNILISIVLPLFLFGSTLYLNSKLKKRRSS